VKEIRGYVKASTSVLWRAGPADFFDLAKQRFDAWSSAASERSYSEAVSTMLSDSIFGADVPVNRQDGNYARYLTYTAPIPPSRVDIASLVQEPPVESNEAIVEFAGLSSGGKGSSSRLAASGDSASDLGDEETQPLPPIGEELAEATPYDDRFTKLGATKPPWHLEKYIALYATETPGASVYAAGDMYSSDITPSKQRGVLRLARNLFRNSARVPGEIYELSCNAQRIGLQFAELHGGALVDGHDGITFVDPPGIGAALVSINGVRTAGLSFAASMALLEKAKRPINIAFVEATPDQLADSLGFFGDENNILNTTNNEQETIKRCKESDVDRAIADPAAIKLREQLDEFVHSFHKCDLRQLHKQANKKPGSMFWSAVDFAVRFLKDKGLLGGPRTIPPGRSRGGIASGSSRTEEKEASFWADVRRHIEKKIMARIFEAIMQASPEARNKGDEALSLHLARLRFLRLADLGVVTKIRSSSKNDEATPIDDAKEEQIPMQEERNTPVEEGAEWVVAQYELFEVAQSRTPSEALDRLASSVRFIASAVEACSNRGRPLAAYNAIGADELLPAITWTVIQANPPRLASMLWFIDEYARDDMLRAEYGYAYANLSAAVNFARETLVDVKPLEGLISKDDFDKGVKTAHLTQKAVDAALKKDARQLRLLLAAGADVSGPSVDQSTTPLVAAIESKEPECVAAALAYLASSSNNDTSSATSSVAAVEDRVAAATNNQSQAHIRSSQVDAPINRGSRQGMTALMVAAALGETDAVCGLLALGADPERVDARGRSAGHLARDAGYLDCAEALDCGSPTDPDFPDTNPLVYRALADVATTRGLLLRGADVNKTCGLLGCPPIVAAAAAGDVATLSALLSVPEVDVDACATSGPFAGQTALMRCVGIDATAADQHNSYRSNLAKQGKLKLPKAVLASNAASAQGQGFLRSFASNLLRGGGGGISTTDNASNLNNTKHKDELSTQSAIENTRQPLNNDRLGLRGFVMPSSADIQVAIACKLLKRGASRTKVDASGRNALRWAETSGGHARLVAVLRNDPRRDRIYDKARDRRSADVVALLEQGVDPDLACPEKAYTALVAAAYNDDVGLARLLISPPPQTVFFDDDDTDTTSSDNEKNGSWFSSKGTNRVVTSNALQRTKRMSPNSSKENRQQLLTRWRPANVNRRGRGGLTPLMYAAQRKSQALVTLLLRKGADREAQDDRGRRAIDHAEATSRALDGSDAATREQLRELLSVDPRKMLLVEAAARDDAAKVAALIAQGASPNECRRIHSTSGWHLELYTPLVAACAYDAQRAATALLDAPGTRLDLSNPQGLTPLMYAGYRGSSSLLLALLRAGADRYRRDRYGRTALDWAKRRAQADAETLKRVAKSSRSSSSDTSSTMDRSDRLAVPLLKWDPRRHTTQKCAANGEVDGVVALVKQGVDINHVERGQPHETALLACCAMRHLEVLSKLLTHPAIDINLADSRGVTALMTSAAAGFDDGVLNLLAAKADRYAATPQGRIAADYATEHGHTPLAALLRADPDRVSIHDAAQEGDVLTVDGLLRQRPSLLNDRRPSDGNSALLIAAASKRLKVVELLLKYPDISVDLTNARKETPLMHAAKAGALDIASRLLAKGASTRAKDIDGRNPTSWATQRSYSNMMLYLALLSVS